MFRVPEPEVCERAADCVPMQSPSAGRAPAALPEEPNPQLLEAHPSEQKKEAQSALLPVCSAAATSPDPNIEPWVKDFAACKTDLTCSPTQLRWRWRGRSVEPARAASHNCRQLSAAGIRTVHIVGDSFARHAFVALALTLSGNMRSGALQAGHGEECEYGGQFSEKECRAQLSREMTGCNGGVRLRYLGSDTMPSLPFMHCVKRGSYDCHVANLKEPPNTGNFPLPNQSDWELADVVLWGIGRHRVPGRSNLQAFDADGIDSLVLQSMCNQSFPRAALIQRKLIWIDTVARTLPPTSPRECPETIAAFRRGMADALRRTCGVTRVASIWNATNSLVRTPGSAWQNLTYDGVHWSMPVSLLYADAIMEQLVLSPVRQIAPRSLCTKTVHK